MGIDVSNRENDDSLQMFWFLFSHKLAGFLVKP